MGRQDESVGLMATYDPNAPDGTRPLNTEPVWEVIGICHRCRHRRSTWTCDAFPDGIPTRILTGAVDHTKPYFNDNGIQFDLKF